MYFGNATQALAIINVSPFFDISVRPDYLYSTGNKRVESFGVVIDVAKYYLGISYPERTLCHPPEGGHVRTSSGHGSR